MAYDEKEEAPVPSQDDYDRITRRIEYLEQRTYDRFDEINKKIKFLIGILVDKKILGAELAKSIQETKEEKDPNKLVEWLTENLDK